MNQMNAQSSLKDFAWYKTAEVKPIEKVVYPTRSFTAQPTDVKSAPYSKLIHSVVETAKHAGPQQPTIISIDSNTYTAPIQILSVEHVKPVEQIFRPTMSSPRIETIKLTQDPIMEPKSVGYSIAPQEELPANDSTKDSLLEETEPLLNHSWKETNESLSDNIGIVDDLGLSDTLGASELKESTGFTDESSSHLEDLTESHVESSNPALDSSIQIMKRNSLKLDSLNFLDSDLESGAQFDSNVADLVNLDYKGEESTLAKETSDIDDLILDNDKWNFFYSRRTPGWVIEAEEQERMERTSRGQDPILLGKWHQVQRQLMTRFPASTSALIVEKVVEKTEEVKEALGDAKETVTEALGDARETVAETLEDAREVVSEIMHETFAESTNLLSSGISGMLHWGAEATHQLVDSAKTSLGIYKSGTVPYINALEEKERLTRMNSTVDPVVDAKKRHVELELMNAIKPAC